MSGLVLKIIAMLCMLIDHIAASFGLSFFPSEVYWVMRYIGRIAFPVFCFLIVEGALHTRDPYRYLARLGIFALISEIPFNLAFDRSVIKPGSTNVFFTLFLGLLAIIICQKLKAAASAEKQIAATGAILICCLAAELLCTDYSSGGVLVIISMYFLHDKPAARDAVMLLILSLFFGPVELFGAASIVLFFFYNGRRGKTNRFLQYFFYAFYPLHLTIIWILSYCFLY